MNAASSSAAALRPFVPADAVRCAEIFRVSIDVLAEDDYDDDQRSAWASAADDAKAFGARLAAALTLVAVDGGDVVGFASLKGKESIDLLYVHPDAARAGIGAMLIDALTRLAIARGAAKLSVDASDTARALFQRAGFVAQRRNMVQVGGEWLANTTMDKALAAAPNEKMKTS